MKTATLCGAILTALLFSSFLLSIGHNTARAQSHPNTPADLSLSTSEVAIIIGNENLDQESTMQARRLLENKGLPYSIVADSDLSILKNKSFSLIIVLGSTNPQLGSHAADLRITVERGTGLIWIGQGLPESLNDILGLTRESTMELVQGTTRIEYAGASTQLFSENVEMVDSANATIKGYFVDKSDRFVAPAELSFKRGSSGLTYYFAYDACSWWFADQVAPWLRAYRLHLAIEDVLSEHLTVRLSPFPRNMQSVFITRIEDVDPLHTNPEWLDRAANLLNYYSGRNAPLTVALIPTYVDPQIGLNFGIEALTAQALKDWLSGVLMRGGTIVEHGYTHQIGNEKTGVSPEFLDSTTQTWFSLEAQKLRIETGANQIYGSLGFDPKGFEAPHYVANNDTYRALSELGFQYVTHNSNTAFFDRYNIEEGLVNVPETLGYIPFNATKDAETSIMSNMDILYNMSGVMLYFNHLFDDQMLQTGKELLDYAQTKEDVWITNTDNLADFWTQRLKAYEQMTVNTTNTRDEVTVHLGSSNRAGLTLALSNAPQIKNIIINGIHWPVFNSNNVILPTLPENSNTVIITFKETTTNTNQVYGYLLVILSTAISASLILKTLGTKKLFTNIRGWSRRQ